MAYEINVSFTALCPSCGKELGDSAFLTESRSKRYPLDMDNPFERCARRVFVSPCSDCFVHRSELARATGGRDGR